MFNSGHWAQAFINSIEKEDGNIEEGLEILKTLASWVSSLPGAVFGNSAAEKAEKLIRSGIARCDISRESETAVRFIVLMVRKDSFRRIGPVTDKIQAILDKRHGVIRSKIEYAQPLGEDFEIKIKDAIKKRKGAATVELTGQLNPDLIGGYRVRIGDEVIDASVRSQLRNLGACLRFGMAPGSLGEIK